MRLLPHVGVGGRDERCARSVQSGGGSWAAGAGASVAQLFVVEHLFAQGSRAVGIVTPQGSSERYVLAWEPMTDTGGTSSTTARPVPAARPRCEILAWAYRQNSWRSLDCDRRQLRGTGGECKGSAHA